MARISTYEVVPVPKLADKLIGTSVGGEIEDITYNFTLLELLNLFLPIIPANNLQGVLDYGNTATQDIVLYGTIYTTNLEVTNTATLLDSYLNGDTNVLGALYDVNGSKGLAAQVLTSTGNYVEWVTLPPIFTPNLQQVLTVGNTANLDIILTANIQALDINVNTATVNNNITIDGTITDGYSSVGTLNQVLSSTGTDIKWVNLPVYSATSPLFLDSITGIFSIQQSNGTQNGYLSAADWITFNGKQNAGNYITALTGEATATGPGSVAITLSNPAVTGKVLTGLSITGGSISAADSILSAFGKVQNQLNGLVGGVMFKGVWNAFTNTPTLTSSIGTQGWYYIVDVAGTTNLNGITDWQVGDWAIFNGSTWNKIDNTDLVTSVNGQVGAVSLTTDDISEGSLNLYFTDTRARNSVSATTPLAYNNISGVFSIQVATTSQDGYLTSTDWTTFNSKQNALSGTGLVKSTSGTITYITDNSSNWNTAYNDSIVSAAVTGTSTKTLTLNQQDGGTITASWSDIDTGLTSVGLSMPVAFSVANTPLISNGTLAVTAIGTATQYIRGDGQLATLPTGGSGGSSVFYYLNGSIAASVATYKQMSNTAIIGAGTDFNLSGNGLIAQFLTDAGNPNRLEIPGGAWNFEMFFSMSSSGGTPQFYVELLKYDGAVFTSIASSSIVPETISGGTATDLYLTSLAVPTTTLLLTDRLAVRVYIVNNSGGRTATLHTEDGNLCQIITTFSSGISAINGLTSNNQYLAVGTAGIDFAINSLLETHTFNLPTSSAINRGALSSADWTTFNDKLSTTTAASTYVPYTGATTNVDLGTNFLFSDYGKFYRGILMSQSGGGYSATGYTGISASGTNGVTFNTITQANILSFNSSALRTYTFPDDSGTVALVGGAGVGTVTSVAALTLGTTGTDLSSTVANSTTTPVITLNVPTASASNRGALSSTDWTTFNSKQASGSYITSLTGEATGLGPGATAVTLNNASVTAKILTGVNITGGTVVATDTMLTAFGKLQNQINGLIGGSIYQGTWDASTNTPILTSSVGTQGYYYIVSVAGTTNLNGITDWFVGDWAIFNGGVWQQVDNTDSVVSVNGQTGAVSLTTDNISEGTTNLYFTNLRARAAITLTTTGTSGASTYNSTTGALNIPQYQDVLTNPVTGSGGANFIPKFTSASIIANSQIYDNGTGVGVGITTLGAYFDVNGTGRFSGQLTLSSTLSNGTYTYTLPSATGTLALTSALSGYLPLTGGTLTGALGGTSATFTNSATTTSVLYTNNNSSGAQHYQDFGNGAGFVAGRILRGNGASGYVPNGLNILSYDALQLSANATGGSGGSINLMGGNVLIGTTTDAGYKLDVNGTGRFSGVITAGVTGNNTNAITFAAATSAKTHLGAGFGATFLQNNNYYNGSAYIFDDNTVGSSTITLGETIAFQTGAANTAPSTKLTIASTGAANFSNSLRIQGSTVPTSGSGTELAWDGTNGYLLAFNRTTSAYLPLYVQGSSLNFTGAATFSGIITSTKGNNQNIFTSQSATTGYQYIDMINTSGRFIALVEGATAGTTFTGSLAYAAAVGTDLNKPLQLYTSNIARLTIDGSTGNVLIGTTTDAGYKLDVNGTGRFSGDVTITKGSAASFIANNTSASGKSYRLFSSDDGKFYIQNTGIADLFNIASTGAATFSSSVTNKVTNISADGAGVVLQGYVDNTLRIAVRGSGYNDGARGGLLASTGEFGSLGTGLVYSNGGLLTSTNPSDSKLKENITDISWGLKDILKLRPVHYTWKKDLINQGLQFGFIAQEVKEVMPEAIKEFGEDVKYLGLEKDAIYATLVKAVQELSAKNEALIKRIETLENK
jgi:hypothetical protein